MIQLIKLIQSNSRKIRVLFFHPLIDRLVLFSVTQRRRQHVISELVSTERDYVRDLDLLIETFLNPSSISCVRINVIVFRSLKHLLHHLHLA